MSPIAETNEMKRPLLRGRFAPSPSGRFHIGNIFASLIATLVADEMVLRIEDLDPDRSKQEHIDAIMRDLAWFGFEWVDTVVYQSTPDQQERYQHACEVLEAQGLVYPCFCTRADLHSARAPHVGEEFIYQNTCKGISPEVRSERMSCDRYALRLDVAAAPSPLCFADVFQGESCLDLVREAGDFIIKRSDGVFAYQLAVVADDAASGIDSVVRGVDLLTSTPKQIYLQRLLGLPTPVYGHVPIFVDGSGRKLSKRNKDASLGYLIDDLGLSAEAILGYLAYCSGIIPEWEAMSIAELKREACLSALEGKRTIVWQPPTRHAENGS